MWALLQAISGLSLVREVLAGSADRPLGRAVRAHGDVLGFAGVAVVVILVWRPGPGGLVVVIVMTAACLGGLAMAGRRATSAVTDP